MARRSVGVGGYALTVEVPDRVVGRLRRRPPAAAEGVGELVFWPEPLTPVVQQRDVDAAVRFFQPGPAEALPVGAEVPHRWYHTIELPDGTVTPGQFDHRPLLPSYGLPTDLTGRTALDAATFDGFWAFEMERRGATVTAVDLDDFRDLDFPDRVRPRLAEVATPAMGDGFAIAREALGSAVTRVGGNVYDLSPERVGTFDLVHVADLLLHLRRPLAALTAMRSVCTGELLLVDVVDPTLARGTFGPTTQYRGGWDDITWWVPSLDALAQMVIDAGFSAVRVNTVYKLAKTTESFAYWRASITATV